MGLVAVGLVATVTTALAGEGLVDHPFRIVLWVLAGLGCGALLLQLLERVPPEQRHTVRRPVAASTVVAVSATLLAWLERPAWLLGGPADNTLPHLVGWAGSVAVVLGAVVVAATGHNHRPTVPVLSGGLVSGVLVTVLLAAVAWTGGQALSRPLAPLSPLFDGVDHTTADADSPGSAPFTLGEVAWTWQPPEEARPVRLLPTAGGAVVDLGHGVIALDTAAGEQTWHYLLPGTEMTVNVTPDWETTVLSHETEEGSVVVALNSITGKPRGHAVLPTPQEADIGLLTAEARILLEQTDEGWQLTARSLADDAHLWSRPLSSHCLVQQQTRSWIRTYDDRIVVAQPCHPELPRTPPEELAELSGGTNRLTSYDADTGEEEWTHEWEAEEPFGTFPELAHHHDDTRLEAPPFTASGPVVAVKHHTDGHEYLVLDLVSGTRHMEHFDLAGYDDRLHFTPEGVTALRHDPETDTLVYEFLLYFPGKEPEMVARMPAPDGPDDPDNHEWVTLMNAVVAVRPAADSPGRYLVDVAPWNSAAEPSQIPLDGVRLSEDSEAIRLVPVRGVVLVTDTAMTNVVALR
ncbi:outer membrane protein assembly factor BamB family protein [Thermobifida halotolerans]|uniref:outer membrane protein assembly factor BamB family protein n=1 Tax=Thermobifida halotolerans TaxID=483545 RepID=UPI000E650833|nr:PQQ-binding-like beta-propeller repeat protein [Thermobifida halotolerans]